MLSDNVGKKRQDTFIMRSLEVFISPFHDSFMQYNVWVISNNKPKNKPRRSVAGARIVAYPSWYMTTFDFTWLALESKPVINFLGEEGVYLNHCCIFVILVTQLFLAHIDNSSTLSMLRIKYLFTSVENFCSIGVRGYWTLTIRTQFCAQMHFWPIAQMWAVLIQVWNIFDTNSVIKKVRCKVKYLYRKIISRSWQFFYIIFFSEVYTFFWYTR